MHGFTAATIVFLHNRRAGILSICLAAVIAFSRLYLFVHFPSDVLGGALIGILTALLVYRISAGRWPRQEAEEKYVEDTNRR